VLLSKLTAIACYCIVDERRLVPEVRVAIVNMLWLHGVSYVNGRRKMCSLGPHRYTHYDLPTPFCCCVIKAHASSVINVGLKSCSLSITYNGILLMFMFF